MEHLGDITKINGAEVPSVDVICGGSPCQDLSVAGKRAGLAGQRSGLFMEQVRIVKEMRDHERANGRADEYIRPRYMVWENVPGAFSSNKGKDFQAVLTEIVRIVKEDAGDVPLPDKGKWPHAGCLMGIGDNGQPFSVAYRLHDAQFWGVPQRRKRIALVADFGGTSAPEILFERKGMSGDIAESGEEGEETAGDTGKGVESASGVVSKGNGECFLTDERHMSLTVGGGQAGQGYPCVLHKRGIDKAEPILLESNQNHATIQTDGISTTLPASMGMGGGYVPMIMDKAIGVDSYNLTTTGNVSKTVQAERSDNEHIPCVIENISISFQERAGKPGGGKGILIQNECIGALSTVNNQSVCCLNDQGGQQMSVSEDVSGTLRAEEHGHQPIVFEPGVASRTGGHIYSDGKAGTLRANPGDNAQAVVYGISSFDSNAMKSPNPNSGIYEAETSRTLDNNGGNPACNQGGMIVLEGNGSRPSHKGDGYAESETMYTLNSTEHHAVCIGNGQLHDALSPSVEVSKTLNCMDDPMKVITYGLDRASFNQGQNAKFGFSVEEEMIGAQVAKGPGAVCQNYIVRRLTPLEAERLQGFPMVDGKGWTDIGEWVDSKGKKRQCTDGNRYKALGNSIALPYWAWMAERMVNVLKADGVENPTMASLFDGIGGFPLVYSECGCEPVWASEIEEFCIAVTKIRFNGGHATDARAESER